MNAENNNLKISVMYFMEVLCESLFNEDHLKLAANDIVQLFDKYIADSDLNVRI